MFNLKAVGFARRTHHRFELGGRFWSTSTPPLGRLLLGGGSAWSASTGGDAEGPPTTRSMPAPIRDSWCRTWLSASLGLAILTGDGDFIAITGDLVGNAGIAYYF